MTTRMQHMTRRGPNDCHTVESTRYDIDADGVIEAKDEHVAQLTAEGDWRNEGAWGAIRQAVAEATPDASTGQRVVRTAEQLALAAGVSGLAPMPIMEPTAPVAPVEAAADSDVPPVTETPAVEADETLVISDQMTKKQLFEIATKHGLAVTDQMTKTQLLALFEAHEG